MIKRSKELFAIFLSLIGNYSISGVNMNKNQNNYSSIKMSSNKFNRNNMKSKIEKAISTIKPKHIKIGLASLLAGSVIAAGIAKACESDPVFNYSNSQIKNDLSFSDHEKLMFNESMVDKIHIDEKQLGNYYPFCDQTSISFIDPGSIMGKDKDGNKFDENDMRQNPKKYFCQDQNGYIYVKDMSGQLHCIGKLSVPSLSELTSKAKNINYGSGTLTVVYGNRDLLDIHKILDSGFFQLANPASNFNAIETTYFGDLNKMLSQYYTDETQGPWFMKKCPWTSLFLLHVFNGLQSNGIDFPVKNNFARHLFQKMENGQFEFNLLSDYKITTSAGYINNKIPDDFINANNDGLYRALIIENTPVSLKGGSSGRNYKYNGDTSLIDIYLDAAIPKYYSGQSYSDEQLKAHLRRHYKSIIAYCKSKNIKNAILTLTGCGVFNVPIQFHMEILSDDNIQQDIKSSGTNFFINGYSIGTEKIKDKFDINKEKNNFPKINFLNICKMNSWDEISKNLS